MNGRIPRFIFLSTLVALGTPVELREGDFRYCFFVYREGHLGDGCVDLSAT